MTETQYLQNYFPKDFIKIGDDIFVIPQGFELSIDTTEIGQTLTTASGVKRKDVVAKTENASFKYKQLDEKGFSALEEIENAISNADYETKKTLFLKKQKMQNTNNLYADFKTISIDVADFSKYSYAFRKNGLFVYSGITLKIN